MTTTINASTSTGLVQTADTSGIIKLQSNGVTTNALAWVNFGYVSSAITVRSQYNVSSVTRIGTGFYTVNFNTALFDANYSTLCSVGNDTINNTAITVGARTTTTVKVIVSNASGSVIDDSYIGVGILGN